jgi:hypothetical protein
MQCVFAAMQSLATNTAKAIGALVLPLPGGKYQQRTGHCKFADCRIGENAGMSFDPTRMS